MIRTALAAALLLTTLLPADAFEGRYRTPGISMTIRPAGGGMFKVDAEISSRRCVGVISARGRIQGDRLVAEAMEYGEICRLDIRRKGRVLTVTESGACTPFHGANCNYVGSYTLR
ncbi:hypothetical protein SAMN05428997_105264 [Bosea sp. CRIB-10]|uniref:hypothetical protein n=1 Tax=Bosea sp. CRIB-10 TaxID=378404 RepID=UPI0008EE2ACD|nr:hypothetical protein [Bosea sp. CRIB-10]SFC30389.1 hypothetical protein SAMN05428997_105264 [Bosea sp. CRIB-10]